MANFTSNAFGNEPTVMFAVVVWLLWKNRNKSVFQDDCGQVEGLLTIAMGMVNNILDINCRERTATVKSAAKVTWRPSDHGWLKISTDGAASSMEDWSTSGGVFRGADGAWVSGFQHFLGRGLPLNEELWAILHGLRSAKLRGARKMVAKSDCKTAVKMINECLQGTHSTNLVRQIKEDLKVFDEVRFQFTKRERNSTAD